MVKLLVGAVFPIPTLPLSSAVITAVPPLFAMLNVDSGKLPVPSPL